MQTLTDYSFYYQSTENYSLYKVDFLDNLQQFITEAYDQNRPIRIRGNGHSMNGSSLPRQNEILLLSVCCDHFHFDKVGTITVGSGAAIWDVNSLLKKWGFGLYVYNDGGAPASSVGGYLSAGGIGEESSLYGGFWETVEHVVLVNGKGELIKSVYGDGIFQWLFGSMGQLGFIYEICLRIKPLNDQVQYPLGLTGKVTANKNSFNKLAWYNLLTTGEYADEAIHRLTLLSQIYKHAWVNLPIYRYDITFKKFNPPLLFPEQKPILVLGIWGEPWDDQNFDPKILRLLEHDFNKIILDNTSFRRYVQAEFIFEDFDYEAYFGEEIFSEFRKIKTQLDPKGIFGRGIISAK